ncbi:MAG: hypothetical protein HC831_18980 [Chloroflexia bacterium]|nr:hypothetical protein [Chloroflexia bacterium]
MIPDEIIDRKKEPLKINSIRKDEASYRLKVVDEYVEHLHLKMKQI